MVAELEARAAEGEARSGARGNARGRRARRKNHTPSVLVQKETTIEAKLRHRGLPHTNNM